MGETDPLVTISISFLGKGRFQGRSSPVRYRWGDGQYSCLPSCPACPLHSQQDLFRVLKAYTLYRPEEGYCQAQAPIAAVLLMHMPAEVPRTQVGGQGT